jgi:hypothetical protein
MLTRNVLVGKQIFSKHMKDEDDNANANNANNNNNNNNNNENNNNNNNNNINNNNNTQIFSVWSINKRKNMSSINKTFCARLF